MNTHYSGSTPLMNKTRGKEISFQPICGTIITNYSIILGYRCIAGYCFFNFRDENDIIFHVHHSTNFRNDENEGLKISLFKTKGVESINSESPY